MTSASRKAASAAGLSEGEVGELERGGWNFGEVPPRWYRGLRRDKKRVAFQELTPVNSGEDTTWRVRHENFENAPHGMSSEGRVSSDLEQVSFTEAVLQADRWREGCEVVRDIRHIGG